MKRRGDLELYVRLLRFSRPYVWHIVGLFILSLMSTPIALLAPLPLKIVVDHVIGSEPLPSFLHWLGSDDRQLLVVAVVLLVGVNLTKHLVSLGRNLLSAFTGERLVLGFRQKIFEHAQRLSLVYHDRRGTADAIYRIQSDAGAIKTVALEGFTPFITSVVTVLGMLLVTAAISPQLAVIAITVVPALFFVTHVYRKTMRAQWREVKTHESRALAVVQEVLGALRLVKAFGQEEREGQRFERRTVQGLRARLRVVASQGTFSTALGLITTAGTAAVLYVGVRSIQTSEITLGDLLLVMAYLGQLYDPMSTMGKKVAELQNAFASAERAFELVDLAPDVPESMGTVHLGRAEGSVRFENVWFAYPEGSDILRGADLNVPAGSTVGIVGMTGAGKTTLVSLIARFYDPTQGRVLLDGRDLRDYALRDVRKQLAIVLQEPVLFSTSIRENIEYGRPDARAGDVIAAAMAANVHDFIVALPDGYETVVGERGMRLSGGERQRIALARAFLKDAPILILDEPTSSVDVKTEAGIVEAMQRLMEGRTTFMIAHRLGTLDQCDLLLMIRDGSVHEIPRGSTGDVAAALQQAEVVGNRRAST